MVGRQNHRWTIPSIYSRSVEVLRDEGVLSLWFKVLGELAYRRLLLLRRPLDAPTPTIEPSLAIEVGRLEESDTEQYLDFRLTGQTEQRSFFMGRNESASR